jgi:hypothetical protein
VVLRARDQDSGPGLLEERDFKLALPLLTAAPYDIVDEAREKELDPLE